MIEIQTACPAKRWSMAGWDGFRRGGRVREAEGEEATKGAKTRTGAAKGVFARNSRSADDVSWETRGCQCSWPGKRPGYTADGLVMYCCCCCCCGGRRRQRRCMKAGNIRYVAAKWWQARHTVAGCMRFALVTLGSQTKYTGIVDNRTVSGRGLGAARWPRGFGSTGGRRSRRAQQQLGCEFLDARRCLHVHIDGLSPRASGCGWREQRDSRHPPRRNLAFSGAAGWWREGCKVHSAAGPRTGRNSGCHCDSSPCCKGTIGLVGEVRCQTSASRSQEHWFMPHSRARAEAERKQTGEGIGLSERQ